jgi:NAD(P)-dependent dehydrogenase (short-subunit alcohol dehydrogenase family)
MLNNKRYLVTGASNDSDIGMAICRTLVKNGAQLVLAGRREANLQATLKELTTYSKNDQATHKIAPFDLSALDEISPWFKQLVAEHGPFDGIVHSASFQGYSPLKLIKAKQISDYFDINFSAALMLISALSKKGHFNPQASAVVIGSAAGLKGLKARTLYASSKAAVSAMVKSCALELADKQIRVNCVAPALVAGSKADEQLNMLSAEQGKQLLASHPLGLSQPEDVANAVLYLLSDMGLNVTGTTLAVDGGYLAG